MDCDERCPGPWHEVIRAQADIHVIHTNVTEKPLRHCMGLNGLPVALDFCHRHARVPARGGDGENYVLFTFWA